MPKPKVEVHAIPELVKADQKVLRAQHRVAILRQTRLRVMHDGGRGWVAELVTTDAKIEQALTQLRDAVSLLNSAINAMRGR